jgi:peptidyl-prolyl cis-trans isomerase C
LRIIPEGINLVKSKYLHVFSVLIGVFAFLCSRTDNSPVIAKVGNEKLTLDELKRSIPFEYRDQISKEQNVSYVKQWMDTELLFQEAIRKKLDRDPEIKNRLKKMQKDLLSAEIISRFSFDNQDSAISPSAVSSYYIKHQKDFIRDSDKIKYLEIIVEDQKTAWYINRNLTNLNFGELSSQYSKIPSTVTANVSFIPVDEIPVEIRNVINNYSIEVNTVPIKTDLGYHVIRILEKLNKNDFCNEDEVRDEIISILTNLLQKQRIEKLLSDLRLKTDVQFNFELLKDIPLDTMQQK